MVYTCPYCEKQFEVPNVVIRNAESYDKQSYNITCVGCKGPVMLRLYRAIVLLDATKGDFAEDDWGERTTYKEKKSG